MRLLYTLRDAIEHLKSEIERDEVELKITQHPWARPRLRKLIAWKFEKGLDLIRFARRWELDRETIDWFLGRKLTSDGKSQIAEDLPREHPVAKYFYGPDRKLPGNNAGNFKPAKQSKTGYLRRFIKGLRDRSRYNDSGVKNNQEDNL